MNLRLLLQVDSLSFGDESLAILFILPLLLLLAMVYWTLFRRSKRRELAAEGPLSALIDSASPGRDLRTMLLITLALSLLTLALMKPRYGNSDKEVSSLGIDVAFVLDASKSMLLTDLVPNRLGLAKHEILETLKQLSGGRAALIPFAGLAFEQTGLTTDFAVLENDLKAFRIEDMPRGGTAIGRGLSQALTSLFPEIEDDPASQALSEFQGSEHKAIILLTDGEDHEGDAIEVAKEAKKRGVKIFAVGVGTAQGRPVLEIDEEGRELGTLKGPDGQPIFSSLNMDLLKDIAKESGGDYFLLGGEGLGGRLTQALSQLEQEEYASTFKNLGEERFQWLVFPAFLLLALEFWLSSRSKARAKKVLFLEASK